MATSLTVNVTPTTVEERGADGYLSTEEVSVLASGGEGPLSGGYGYPGAVTVFQERLVFGGSRGFPQTVWASKVGEWYTFKPGTNDADPYSYTLATRRSRPMSWLRNTRALLVGTEGGEFLATGGQGGPITPSSVSILKQSSHGCRRVDPEEVGNEVLFVTRDGTRIRSFQYSRDVDGYGGSDLAFLAEHITEKKITRMAFQEYPDPILWIVMEDGSLASMSYDPSQGMAAWSQHPTEGDVVDVLTLQNDGVDEVYFITERPGDSLSNNFDKLFLEKATPDTLLDNWAEVTSSVDGNGKKWEVEDLSPDRTCWVIGDDSFVYEDLVVQAEGGTRFVETERVHSKIKYGFNYQRRLTTLPFEGGSPAGTAQGEKKYRPEVWLRMNQSFYAEINGVTPDTLNANNSNLGQLDNLEDRDIRVFLDSSGEDRKALVDVIQKAPVPTRILALFGDVRVDTV